MSQNSVNQFCLCMADVTVGVICRYQYTAEYCRDYLIPPVVPDVTVDMTDGDQTAPSSPIPGDDRPGYMEFLSLCRRITDTFALRGILLLHAAVIDYDGAGYGFFAPSGTGKSTHIRYWRERYGNAVNIVNGDKPFIRKKNGVFTAYGSPFCGKERWQRNVAVPLRALCRLTRGTTDSVSPLSVKDAVTFLLNQIYIPRNPLSAGAVMDLTDELLRTVPLFILTCTNSIHAAEVAHDTLTSQNGK